MASTIALEQFSQKLGVLILGHPSVWAPSQYNATYSTSAASSCLVHSSECAVTVVCAEIFCVELENKLLLEDLVGFLSSFSVDSSADFLGAVLPGVFPLLPGSLLLLISD